MHTLCFVFPTTCRGNRRLCKKWGQDTGQATLPCPSPALFLPETGMSDAVMALLFPYCVSGFFMLVEVRRCGTSPQSTSEPCVGVGTMVQRSGRTRWLRKTASLIWERHGSGPSEGSPSGGGRGALRNICTAPRSKEPQLRGSSEARMVCCCVAGLHRDRVEPQLPQNQRAEQLEFKA